MIRKAFGGAVVVAAVLGLGGCQRTGDNARQAREELAQKEREAREDISEIRQDTQKEVAEQRAEGQQEVAEVQKDLAEERQDVQEADREAAEEAREEAAEDFELGTGGAGAAATTSMTGTLKSSMLDNLVVRDEKGAELKLDTDSNTKVTYNGQPAKLDSFKEGTKVRVTYSAMGDKKMAKDVVIVTPVKE